jgi:hypothetical protein
MKRLFLLAIVFSFIAGSYAAAEVEPTPFTNQISELYNIGYELGEINREFWNVVFAYRVEQVYDLEQTIQTLGDIKIKIDNLHFEIAVVCGYPFDPVPTEVKPALYHVGISARNIMCLAFELSGYPDDIAEIMPIDAYEAIHAVYDSAEAVSEQVFLLLESIIGVSE